MVHAGLCGRLHVAPITGKRARLRITPQVDAAPVVGTRARPVPGHGNRRQPCRLPPRLRPQLLRPVTHRPAAARSCALCVPFPVMLAPITPQGTKKTPPQSGSVSFPLLAWITSTAHTAKQPIQKREAVKQELPCLFV